MEICEAIPIIGEITLWLFLEFFREKNVIHFYLKLWDMILKGKREQREQSGRGRGMMLTKVILSVQILSYFIE